MSEPFWINEFNFWHWTESWVDIEFSWNPITNGVLIYSGVYNIKFFACFYFFQANIMYLLTICKDCKNKNYYLKSILVDKWLPFSLHREKLLNRVVIV